MEDVRDWPVLETAVKIAAPVKVDCSQHDGEPTDHWRKRRWIPQEPADSELETGIRTLQKIAKLNKKSTKADYEFGGSASSISSTRKTHVFSKSSRLCRFRKTGIGRRNWPIAFARCTPSNAAVESFCEFSRKLTIDQAASGGSRLATVVDGMMHRARLQALKALRDEQEQILFLKSADGLTKVLFSNTSEAHQINTESSCQEVKIQGLNKDPHSTNILPSVTPPVQGVFKNPVNDPILDSKVIQEDDQLTQVAPPEALESLFLPPVESRVIGKNGCRFKVDSSRDEICLFRSLPEQPVLVPPSTTVLTGLAQPPPLARFRTSTESSNSVDFGSHTDGDFSDNIVNRPEASYQPPVLVSIPYIDLGGGGGGHLSGLKTGTGSAYTSSFGGGVQSCGSSGSFFVNSIPQSLKEAIQPHLPFVQDFQKSRLPSFSNSTSESAFASIFDLIKNGEEALQSTLKKEEKSEVFKEVISGKVINKVIVE